MFKFAKHGQCGTWVSELLRNTPTIVDELCVVKSLNTEAINHDPATTLPPDRLAAARPAEPRGLAELRHRRREQGPASIRGDDLARLRQQDRPADFFASMGQRIPSTQHQGVRLRSGEDPVLVSVESAEASMRQARRRMLDGVGQLNKIAESIIWRSGNQHADPTI